MAKAYSVGRRPKTWWPVDVDVAEDGGKVETYRFKILVEPLTTSELRAVGAGELNQDECLRNKIHDWDGPVDPDGEAVPYSTSALDDMMEDLGAMEGLVRALREVSNGGGARKNSKTSRG